MPDRFQSHAGSLDGPATNAFAISPHDTNPLAETTRALYVGGPGAVVVELISGAEVTFANVAASSLLPVRVTRVKATGTTATQMLGLV